ncbi:MAG: mannose-6-phosphate isomerase [Candidatus Azobacteroides sp.]|nr:mannose-6-phosphate isomerase [Candidatus Azobacteroides sp.]
MKLYPLTFKPILKSTIWGGNEICKFKNLPSQDGIGESWEISQVKNDVSVVAEGELAGKNLGELIELYGADLLGKENLNKYGGQFPLLIKFIDARDDLSIQVHPNDELAKKRHNSFGKTEMWYVVKAEEGATLYSGFAQKITPEEYVTRVKNNTFTDVLQLHRVAAGDVFYLPAGRVHAIRSNTFIAEIQQTSDITYRIYDYNRKDAAGNSRELHTELAKDAIDYNLYDNYKTEYKEEVNTPVKLVDSPYFHTTLLHLTETITRDFSSCDSFVIYMCLSGEGRLTDDNGASVNIRQGMTVLIPATTKNITIHTEKEIKLLEVHS